jgi:glycosyltransferase involved in cell wall biosynthesis
VKVTAVVITRDRPLQVERLIDSISHSKMASFSLVLIDDSSHENFESIENLLLSYGKRCEHKRSSEARREVENDLKEMDLARAHRSLVETCVGLKSPFVEFAESLSKIFLCRESLSAVLSQSFSPYSTARNLGIYCARRAYDPERIVFLDDDCYVKSPERLTAALQLIGKKIDRKEIVAVSGLYEDLSLYTPRGRHPYEEPTPTSILTGMKSFLERSFLTNQQQRLTLMPYHTLGGALILSKRVFVSLPFDPFIPRGEDHAYCIDLKDRYGRDFAIVRDNLFLVQHDKKRTPENLQEINTLRDIFRFVYLRLKVGHHFIPYFTIRWTLNAVTQMFLEPSKSKQRILELCSLLFLARIYAKRNVDEYSETVKAWESFLKRIGA